jgi:succinate dehydrogenase / fumarate reductase, membrane anchor subunit
MSAADLQTPLKRVRGLGSSKSGTHHFIVQRVTALALIPLVLWIIWLALALIHADYAHARSLVHQPINALLLIAFVVAAFWHAQLGLQVVIEDYVHGDGAKLALIVAVRFIAVLFGLAAIVAVLRIGFGS